MIMPAARLMHRILGIPLGPDVVHDRKHGLDLVLGHHLQLGPADEVHDPDVLEGLLEEGRPGGERGPGEGDGAVRGADDGAVDVDKGEGGVGQEEGVEARPLLGVGEAGVLGLL
jgi:hypothetical protein